MEGIGGWDKFKKTAKFSYPKNFPAIQDIMVQEDKIYINTYEMKDNNDLNYKQFKQNIQA